MTRHGQTSFLGGGRSPNPVVRRLRRLIPAEGGAGDLFLAFARLWSRRRRGGTGFSGSLLAEMAKLPIAEAGTAPDGVPFLALESGPTFYGYPPTPQEAARYRHLPAALRRAIPQSCIRIAMDVVFRYVYPHALVTLTPPYPVRERRGFHRQHCDTIEDIPGLSPEEERALRQRFEIRQGDVVLDVGAFIGFGALRLRELVGTSGKVVSIEADASHQALFLRNMEANHAKNVRLIRRAVWKASGDLKLHCDGMQANSLIPGVVKPRTAVTVKVDSIDNVVSREGLAKVSLISVTVNGAEIEAVQGMEQTLRRCRPNLSLAGWYQREDKPVHAVVTPLLRGYGYRTLVGPCGRVYAWSVA